MSLLAEVCVIVLCVCPIPKFEIRPAIGHVEVIATIM